MRISHFTVTFIALCLSFLTCPLRGQGSHPFRHLNVDNGLSSNYVVDIAQDYQGFIWIATESGLNKFDGTEVTVYNTQNSALSSNELNTVYCDPSTRTVYPAPRPLCLRLCQPTVHRLLQLAERTPVERRDRPLTGCRRGHLGHPLPPRGGTLRPEKPHVHSLADERHRTLRRDLLVQPG